jgi:hypothetical protein
MDGVSLAVAWTTIHFMVVCSYPDVQKLLKWQT